MIPATCTLPEKTKENNAMLMEEGAMPTVTVTALQAIISLQIL